MWQKGNKFFDIFDEREIFIQKAVQRDRKYAFSWDHRYVVGEGKKRQRKYKFIAQTNVNRL